MLFKHMIISMLWKYDISDLNAITSEDHVYNAGNRGIEGYFKEW